MNRNPDAFVQHGYDCLLRAVNNAHSFLQRKRVFEHARVLATIPSVDIANGGSLDDAVIYGTQERIVIRSVEKAYLDFSNAQGQFPVSIISRDAWASRKQRQNDSQFSTEYRRMNLASYPIELVMFGRNFYFNTVDPNAFSGNESVNVHFDAVRWFPDYQTDSDSDIFTEHCFDFLVYRACHELNFFLKEDQRVAISKDFLAESWDSIVAWDSTMVYNAVDDPTLD